MLETLESIFKGFLDIAGLLFYKQQTIRAAGLVRAALYSAEGQGIKRG
jgi:hypothetical protein